MALAATDRGKALYMVYFKHLPKSSSLAYTRCSYASFFISNFLHVKMTTYPWNLSFASCMPRKLRKVLFTELNYPFVPLVTKLFQGIQIFSQRNQKHVLNEKFEFSQTPMYGVRGPPLKGLGILE